VWNCVTWNWVSPGVSSHASNLAATVPRIWFVRRLLLYYVQMHEMGFASYISLHVQ
jgi:hypothetical protein